MQPQPQYTLVSSNANQYNPFTLTLTATQDCYAVVYVANESQMDVFFDDILVEHERMVWQENHYYAFGMGMKPLDREGAPEHRWKYNGKELDDMSELLEYEARLHDPQLGRFHALDPKAETYNTWSPYVYAGNDPIRYMDVRGEGPGDWWETVVSAINSYVKETGDKTYKALVKADRAFNKGLNEMVKGVSDCSMGGIVLTGNSKLKAGEGGIEGSTRSAKNQIEIEVTAVDIATTVTGNPDPAKGAALPNVSRSNFTDETGTALSEVAKTASGQTTGWQDFAQGNEVKKEDAKQDGQKNQRGANSGNSTNPAAAESRKVAEYYYNSAGQKTSVRYVGDKWWHPID